MRFILICILTYQDEDTAPVVYLRLWVAAFSSSEQIVNEYPVTPNSKMCVDEWKNKESSGQCKLFFLSFQED